MKILFVYKILLHGHTKKLHFELSDFRIEPTSILKSVFKKLLQFMCKHNDSKHHRNSDDPSKLRHLRLFRKLSFFSTILKSFGDKNLTDGKSRVVYSISAGTS